MNARNHLQRRLDLYLDDQLADAEVRAFEQTLEEHPDLAAAAEQSRLIDDSLRRSFAPQVSSSDLLDRLAGRTGAPMRNGRAARSTLWLRGTEKPTGGRAEETRRTGLFTRRRLALAAGIAAILIGLWQIWAVLGPGRSSAYQPPQWRPLAQVYRDTVAAGFEPKWICETDEEFRWVFASQYAQPLVLSDLPANIEAVGLSYCNSLSQNTTCVMFRVEGDPVIVFVDRIERDAGDEGILAGAEGLNAFRGTLGKLVLYEITPREDPMALDVFEEVANKGT